MVSFIDPTQPITGIDQPVQVIRDNFAITKIEIEELQARKFDRTGDVMTGILQLAPSVLAGLSSPSFTPGGLLFVTDGAPPAPYFSDGTVWRRLLTEADAINELNDINDVNIGVPGAGQDGFALTWDDASGEFILTPAGSGTVGSVDIDSPNGTVTVSGGPITSSGTLIVDLPDSGVISGSFTNANVTIDAQGRITAASSGVASLDDLSDLNIVAPSLGEYLRYDGVDWVNSTLDIVDDSTPQLGGQLDAQLNKITNLAAPTSGGDATNKTYVDSVASGLDPKESVRLATDGGGDLVGFTFTNIGGIGDTLTAPAIGITSVDGFSLANGDRVLVKDQATATQNGIYVVSDAGAGSATILTRASDQDGSPVNEVSAGNFAFVETGISNASTGWVVSGDGTITINAADINWVQFSGTSGALQSVVEDLTPELGGELDAQSNKIVNLLDPTVDQDAATKKYVDDELFSLSALTNIIDDTTPQLGGDLDVNDNSIVSTSNGDIAITPDGSGSIILDGLDWPQADGSLNQVLTTDGAGNLSFTSIVSSGLDNIVEDLTPQLGANLDANTFDIEEDGNVILSFSSGGELAVNNVDIVHAVTNSGPTIRSVGSDIDVDMTIEPKGDGIVVIGLTGDSEIRGDINSNLSIGGGDSDSSDTGGDTIIISGDGSGGFDSGDIFLIPGIGGTGDGDLILAGLTWPIVDGSPGQALTTNGGGVLGFGSVGSINDVVDDSTPQLGGDLDVNGSSIVSVSNGDIAITPDGAGSVVLDGLNWPQADGSLNEVLTTDGAGNLSFAASGAGSAFATSIATSTPIAASDDDEILVDTSSLAITVNLPGSPTLGDRVRIIDGAGNASSFNITVGRNGEVIMGSASNFIINVDNAAAEFVYMNVANGWRVVSNV